MIFGVRETPSERGGDDRKCLRGEVGSWHCKVAIAPMARMPSVLDVRDVLALLQIAAITLSAMLGPFHRPGKSDALPNDQVLHSQRA